MDSARPTPGTFTETVELPGAALVAMHRTWRAASPNEVYVVSYVPETTHGAVPM